MAAIVKSIYVIRANFVPIHFVILVKHKGLLRTQHVVAFGRNEQEKETDCNRVICVRSFRQRRTMWNANESR